jgi:hypothetical protein
MGFKILAGIVAMALLIAYVAPPVVRLKDPALIIVVLIGVIMMLVDLWQSLKERD